MFGVYSRLGYDKREPTPCSKKTTHKRRSLVNFRGHGFLPEKHVWKINKMPEFYTIFARKISKLPEFFYAICPKS